MASQDALYQVLNQTRGSLVSRRVRSASSAWARLVGLLGQEAFTLEDGLWLKPSSGVHTFGMRFAIDIVALDRQNRVLRTWSSLSPGKIAAFHWRTRSVLELPAGYLLLSGTDRGDQLSIIRADH